MIATFRKAVLLVCIMLSFTTLFSQGVQNYLSTKGNKLIDKRGQEVYLSGVNWFGFETSMFYPHGIWARDMKSVLQQVKDLGFNCIRIPFCSQMLDATAKITVNSFGKDPYSGVSPMNVEEATKTKPIEILDILVNWCQANNLKVILDNHSKKADGYIVEGVWYTDGYDEARWISDWVFLANRYKGKSAAFACDLKNEPFSSTWGNSNPTTDFNKAAERCGNAILKANPEMLIIVEGVSKYMGDSYWWGGQLKGAKDFPVVLSDKTKLMYSAHEYGPEVFNQTWFSDPTFPNNMNGIWEDHFGYLYTNNTSPLFFGEFGIRDKTSYSGAAFTWFKKFMGFIGGKHHWTFWTLNPNSGDTGGILGDDWTSVVQWKMDELKPFLQPIIPNVIGGTTTNQPPKAAIVTDKTTGLLPLAVKFDASTSTDPEGGLLTYSWNFGDNTTGVGNIINHTYNTAGTFRAVLTVKDAQNATDTIGVQIVVTTIVVPVDSLSITASAGTGGTIAPAGIVKVARGSSKTFNIISSAGFIVSNVLVNGTSVGAVTTYTFSNVSSNQTITASFKTVSTTDSISITSSAGTGGTITPAGTIKIPSGGSRTFTITPASGYAITSVLVNGLSVGAVATYTIAGATTNQTIVASFTLIVSGGTCLLTRFAVPRTSPLPTLANASFSKVYTLGTGAPNLANISNAVINWDLPAKGLWQLSFNTNNGIPGWWIDMRSNIQNFASAQPAITFAGTGITNLDGNKYYVNVVDANNIVFVEVTGKHAFYYSNSTSAPAGCTAAIANTLTTQTQVANKVYPNPTVKGNSVTLEMAENVTNKTVQVQITNLTGTVVKKITTNTTGNKLMLNTNDLNTGKYIIKVTANKELPVSYTLTVL